MNLILSYSDDKNVILYNEGHYYLGSGLDCNGKFVYIFLNKRFKSTYVTLDDYFYELEQVFMNLPKG
jgi:hypothetical protein